MRKAVRAALAAAVVAALAAPAGADPASQRDLAGLVAGAPNRYVPHQIGVPVDLHYLFGPYVIPPGQDSNRITLDLPLETGYVVAIAPDLVDATNGRVPTQQEAHIHHAHWLRISEDPNNEYYADLGDYTPGGVGRGKGLSWVFGTGEEKSQGRLDDRGRMEAANSDADPTNDFTYGIPITGSESQTMIYMIHNKLPVVGTYFVVLDVTFLPGTRAEIKAATGRDVHPLYGQLWGQTKTVSDRSTGIGARWTVTHDGVAIAAGSHVHPGGKAVVVSNVGPDLDPGTPFRPLCEGIDPDGDGHDGVAILDSYKFDRDMEVWPYSENYQMGVTKFGWRAPVHKGDVLVQSAAYALKPMASSGVFDTGSRDALYHNWYEAMSYTGIYMDRDQSPGAAPASCTMESLAPHMLGTDTFAEQGLSSIWLQDGAVRPEIAGSVAEIGEDYNLFLGAEPTDHQRTIQGMVNHIWQANEPLCAQAGLPALAARYKKCGPSEVQTQTGPEVSSIHVSGFTYVPGDLGISPPTGGPIIPRVRQGSEVTFVNEDVALNVRHTFTSCAWPCIGTYVSNFPLPTGGATAFDTGKIGNIDYIDGGLDVEEIATGQPNDTIPYYEMTVNLPAGKYAYFCRIHPFMRGAFEVIPAA